VAATEIKRVRGRWFGLAALTASGLVLGLDITILITALPTLSAKLGATTDQLQWMSAAYTLSLAGFMLPAGVLGDRFGRKILLPLVTSILPSMFAEDERQRAIGFSGAGAFIGLPLGPLVAGWLLTHYAWGSIFLINAPVVVIAVVGAWFFIPESKDPDPKRLDWVGALLEMAGVTGIVYAIIEEPVRGWTDFQVMGPLLGGAALIAVFVIWQFRTRVPLVDLNLFRSRRFALATVAFTIVGFAMTGVLFVLSPYLQVVQGNDAQGTGIRLLPLMGAMMVGAAGSAPLSKRLGAKVMVSGGMLGIGAGMVLLSRAGVDTGFALVAIALAVIGLSIAFTMIPALDAILGALPAGETGAGSALTRAIQNVGASRGVAVMGSILNSAYQSHLSGQLAGLPAAAQSAAQTSVAVAAAVARHLPGPLGERLLRAAETAYAQGMSEVLVATAGLLVVGAILMALFLPARAVNNAQPAGSVSAEVAAV